MSSRPLPLARVARRLSAACLLAASVGLFAAAPAHAAAVIGAANFDQGDFALYGSAGLPDLEVGGVIGINSLFDVAPRLRLQYGQATRVGGLGFGLGAALRLRVAGADGWQVAFVSTPDVAVHLDAEDHPPVTKSPSTVLALRPGAPGLVVSRVLGEGLTAAIGLEAPVTVFVQPRVSLMVPLLLTAGVEAALTPQWSLFVHGEVGTAFYGPGGRSDSETLLRLRLGVAWH